MLNGWISLCRCHGVRDDEGGGRGNVAERVLVINLETVHGSGFLIEHEYLGGRILFLAICSDGLGIGGSRCVLGIGSSLKLIHDVSLRVSCSCITRNTTRGSNSGDLSAYCSISAISTHLTLPPKDEPAVQEGELFNCRCHRVFLPRLCRHRVTLTEESRTALETDLLQLLR